MKESEEIIIKCTTQNCQEKVVNETVCSKSNLNEPDMKSDNMKDLKPLDINSADDVRQTFKAVFMSKIPNFTEYTEDYIGVNNDCGNDLLKNNPQPGPALVIEAGCSKSKNGKNHTALQTKKSTELISLKKSNKRKGRPSKTTPLKRMKKQSISTMYIGKLSNIVFLRNDSYESYSDIGSNST